MKSDIEIYCDHLADGRTRMDIIQDFASQRATTGNEHTNIEFVFLQLRLVLELIAFASLTANKDAYAAVDAKFHQRWNAKKLLDDLAEVNSDFYPVPHDPPREIAPGQKHFPHPSSNDFMTKDDFVTLYNAASRLLHTRNPFTRDGAQVQIGYSVQDWLGRIQRLLWWHRVRLIGGNVWIINVPLIGAVQAWPATQLPKAGELQSC